MPIMALVVPYLKREEGLRWSLEGRSVARQALIVSGLLPVLAAPTPTGEGGSAPPGAPARAARILRPCPASSAGKTARTQGGRIPQQAASGPHFEGGLSTLNLCFKNTRAERA